MIFIERNGRSSPDVSDPIERQTDRNNGVAQKILLEILTSGNTGVLKSVFTSGGNGYEPVNVDRCEDFPRAPIAPRPPAGSPPL